MEPITASAIATLAFTKAFEKSIEKFTEATWNKIDALRKQIWQKFGKNQAAQNALTAADTGSQPDLDLVAQYLEQEMEWDKSFAQDVQNLAREIQQEINIGKMQGENVLIVNNGKGEQNNVTGNNAPVIQGGSGHNITFN
ncbi:MAG: hypothetical protein AAGG00_18450 [Cyanobacteria bacterium P01_H01_bin.150]